MNGFYFGLETLPGMQKDPRYKTLKVMLETGNILSFTDIFDVVPKTVVATDLGINYVRFQEKIRRPENFLLKDLMNLAELIDADPLLVLKVVVQDIRGRRPLKKKKT